MSEETFTCTSCNADVSEDANFCPQCGEVFDGFEENKSKNSNIKSKILKKYKIFLITFALIIALITIFFAFTKYQNNKQLKYLNTKWISYLNIKNKVLEKERLKKDISKLKEEISNFNPYPSSLEEYIFSQEYEAAGFSLSVEEMQERIKQAEEAGKLPMPYYKQEYRKVLIEKKKDKERVKLLEIQLSKFMDNSKKISWKKLKAKVLLTSGRLNDKQVNNEIKPIKQHLIYIFDFLYRYIRYMESPDDIPDKLKYSQEDLDKVEASEIILKGIF